MCPGSFDSWIFTEFGNFDPRHIDLCQPNFSDFNFTNSFEMLQFVCSRLIVWVKIPSLRIWDFRNLTQVVCLEPFDEGILGEFGNFNQCNFQINLEYCLGSKFPNYQIVFVKVPKFLWNSLVKVFYTPFLGQNSRRIRKIPVRIASMPAAFLMSAVKPFSLRSK